MLVNCNPVHAVNVGIYNWFLVKQLENKNHYQYFTLTRLKRLSVFKGCVMWKRMKNIYFAIKETCKCLHSSWSNTSKIWSFKKNLLFSQNLSILNLPNSRFLGPRKWPRIWTPFIKVKVDIGAKLFPKLPFLEIF